MAQILDASIAVAWCARAQQTSLSAAALDLVEAHGARVPPPFWYEVMNAIAGLERRRIISSADVAGFLKDVRQLDIRVDRVQGVDEMIELRQLGRAYSLSIFDASYLELALRTGLSLITRDEALAEAAAKAGCAVFAP